MNSIFRLFTIIRVIWAFGLYQLLQINKKLISPQKQSKRVFSNIRFRKKLDTPIGPRIRQALVFLGPIFVKLGQVLSTRRDLLTEDIADELALLQDRVPPFDSNVAIEIIENAFGEAIENLFLDFSKTPIASASIAQVHFATLKDGRKVAVKVLRPGMLKAINKDLNLMKILAFFLEKFSEDGRRLRPKEVIAEFENYLHDELDLVREAANAALLKRNFRDSKLLQIPEMIWEYCKTNVIVMERVYGIPINKISDLKKANVNLEKLSYDGVEIFFTQVFRDGFFHADMHPGNILVADKGPRFGRYIALDFGIVGSLTNFDKSYLTQNFLAFFRRDYKKVAELHIESGWVPEKTRVESLESAIRSVCEPYFDKPLKDISLGQVLLRLFQTSRRFDVKIQPQLVLLQKTLLNVEGLGRQLNPNLDLWSTAKPFLEKWMKEQIGLNALKRNLTEESHQWANIIPKIPNLIFKALDNVDNNKKVDSKLEISTLLTQQTMLFRWLKLFFFLLFISIFIILVLLYQFVIKN